MGVTFRVKTLVQVKIELPCRLELNFCRCDTCLLNTLRVKTLKKDLGWAISSDWPGPAHLGQAARVIEHAAIKDAVSIGHTTKIGGEVEVNDTQLPTPESVEQ